MAVERWDISKRALLSSNWNRNKRAFRSGLYIRGIIIVIRQASSYWLKAAGLSDIMAKNMFNSPSKGKINVGQMVDELVTFMGDDPEYFYRLVIGTDSKIPEQKES